MPRLSKSLYSLSACVQVAFLVPHREYPSNLRWYGPSWTHLSTWQGHLLLDSSGCTCSITALLLIFYVKKKKKNLCLYPRFQQFCLIPLVQRPQNSPASLSEMPLSSPRPLSLFLGVYSPFFSQILDWLLLTVLLYLP